MYFDFDVDVPRSPIDHLQKVLATGLEMVERPSVKAFAEFTPQGAVMTNVAGLGPFSFESGVFMQPRLSSRTIKSTCRRVFANSGGTSRRQRLTGAPTMRAHLTA